MALPADRLCDAILECIGTAMDEGLTLEDATTVLQSVTGMLPDLFAGDDDNHQPPEG